MLVTLLPSLLLRHFHAHMELHTSKTDAFCYASPARLRIMFQNPSLGHKEWRIQASEGNTNK